jgi:hypothetical protein
MISRAIKVCITVFFIHFNELFFLYHRVSSVIASGSTRDAVS